MNCILPDLDFLCFGRRMECCAIDGKMSAGKRKDTDVCGFCMITSRENPSSSAQIIEQLQLELAKWQSRSWMAPLLS